MLSTKFQPMGRKPKTSHPFGLHLVRLRQRANVTQTELADALGVTQPTVSEWETQGTLPGKDILPKMATILGTSPDELLEFAPAKKKRGPKGELDRVIEQVRELPKYSQKHLIRLIQLWVKEAKS
jgi:transcriptional regulator with XRE-family HTH domain